ncbi:hypothetical protein Pgy4_40295, partial [Pseudomonas savastanoi pv. glycinea str. race 4]
REFISDFERLVLFDQLPSTRQEFLVNRCGFHDTWTLSP